MKLRLAFVHATLLLLAIGAVFFGTASTPAAHKFEDEIQAFENQDRANPPPRDANLFIGSSTIRKWKTLAQDFPGVPVINRGFGGSCIADSTYYAKRIVLPYHPKRIFLYAGDNDIYSKLSPQQVCDNFKAFVETVRVGQPDVPIHFISIKPSPSRIKFIEPQREANRLIQEYIKSGKNLTYIDIVPLMLDSSGQPNPDLFARDKLHMSSAGYALWVKQIAPYLK